MKLSLTLAWMVLAIMLAALSGCAAGTASGAPASPAPLIDQVAAILTPLPPPTQAATAAAAPNAARARISPAPSRPGAEPAPTLQPTAACSAEECTPEQTVLRFYNWYLSYQTAADGRARNALADRAYQGSAFLSDALVRKVDGIVAAMGDGRGGYDPFLCAQSMPAGFKVGRAEVGGQRAVVTVDTTFLGHSFTVLLAQTTSAWVIDDVICAAG